MVEFVAPPSSTRRQNKRPWRGSFCSPRSRRQSFILLVAGIFVVWILSFSLWGDGGALVLTTPQHDDDVHIDVLQSMLHGNASATVQTSGAAPNKNSHQQQPSVRVSDLPDASDWKPTQETPYEVCFVTSVYAKSADVSDRPPDIREIQDANPSFRFFAFTNLPDWDAPGWTLKVQTFPYKRFITSSRWSKFMGWKDFEVYKCQAVFYMDGFCGPKLKHSERYKRLARAIHESEWGLFQNEHDVANIGPLEELDRILERRKDIAKNVEVSKAWLQAQPDFDPQAKMYANHYIGYNPKNTKFQQAAEFFWNRYSLEQDSWRDQPLWSYALHRYGITPTRLGTFEALFKEYYRRMGYAGHRYTDAADNNAVTSEK